MPDHVQVLLHVLIDRRIRHQALWGNIDPTATALDLLCMRWHDRDGIPQTTIAEAWGVSKSRISNRVQKGRWRLVGRVRRAEEKTWMLMQRYRQEVRND